MHEALPVYLVYNSMAVYLVYVLACIRLDSQKMLFFSCNGTWVLYVNCDPSYMYATFAQVQAR